MVGGVVVVVGVGVVVVVVGEASMRVDLDRLVEEGLVDEAEVVDPGVWDEVSTAVLGAIGDTDGLASFHWRTGSASSETWLEGWGNSLSWWWDGSYACSGASSRWLLRSLHWSVARDWTRAWSNRYPFLGVRNYDLAE